MRRFPSGRRCIRRRARRPLPGGNLSGKMALQALATYNRLYMKPFFTQTTFNREKNYIYLHRKNRKRKTTAKIYLRRNGGITACHESSRTGKVSDRLYRDTIENPQLSALSARRAEISPPGFLFTLRTGPSVMPESPPARTPRTRPEFSGEHKPPFFVSKNASPNHCAISYTSKRPPAAVRLRGQIAALQHEHAVGKRSLPAGRYLVPHPSLQHRHLRNGPADYVIVSARQRLRPAIHRLQVIETEG